MNGRHRGPGGRRLFDSRPSKDTRIITEIAERKLPKRRVAALSSMIEDALM
jgi:hypothetical protein